MKFYASSNPEILHEPYVVLDVTNESKDWGKILAPIFMCPGYQQDNTLYTAEYLYSLRTSSAYPSFIKFIADAYHTDSNLVFKDDNIGHGQLLVHEAWRFINSYEIDLSQFEIKFYSSPLNNDSQVTKP